MRRNPYAAAAAGLGAVLAAGAVMHGGASRHARAGGEEALQVASAEASALDVGIPAEGAASAAVAAAPRMLIVLGDSLSDIGNAAAVADFLLNMPMYPEPTIGLCNPVERWVLDRDCTDLLYRRSRVTNGPVAVEHLAESLADGHFAPSFHTVPDRPVTGTNYAVAGAKARGDRPQDLEHQLDRLLLDRGPVLPKDAVVVMMIGGNDAIDALQAAVLPQVEDTADGWVEPLAGPPESSPPDDPGAADGNLPANPSGDGAGASTAADEIIAASTEAIGEAADRLLDHGAACVLITNVPDLALLPAVRSAASAQGLDERSAADAATEITLSFNTALDTRLEQIEDRHPTGPSILRFDLAAAFGNAAAEAEAAGINVRDACFDSEVYASSADGERRFDPNCEPSFGEAPRFERFFFWDSIHPTGQVHATIGEALAESALSCPVPTDG